MEVVVRSGLRLNRLISLIIGLRQKSLLKKNTTIVLVRQS